MTPEAVIAKVRKLMALTDSPNEHEAALAASRVTELLARHSIDRATVEASAGEEAGDGSDRLIREETPLDDRRTPGWRRSLASALGAGFGVYVLTWKGRAPRFEWFGHVAAVQTARYLYQTLAREIERLAVLNARGQGRAYSNAYRAGIVSTVRARLVAAREEAIRAAGRSGASSTALVLVRDESKAAEAFARGEVQGIRNVRPSPLSSRSGWEHGRDDGRNVDLGDAGRRALATPRLALGAGGGK